MATSAVRTAAHLHYDPVQLLGIVLSIEDDGMAVVSCDGKQWRVARAASCLLAPSVGDEVLISGPVPQRVYLIAVITQADASVAKLALNGDVELTSLTGDVTLHAAQGLRMQGADHVEIHTQHINLDSRHANLTLDELDYLGRRANIAITAVSWLGSLCEVVVDRLTQVAHTVTRLTHGTEQLRAGHVDYEAQQSARLHAAHTLVTAKNLVKVDADQIHMG